MDHQGEIRRKLHRGPASYDKWLRSWEVYEVCMISCGYAGQGALDAYRRGISRLVARYPGQWDLIGPIELRMREQVWQKGLRGAPFLGATATGLDG